MKESWNVDLRVSSDASLAKREELETQFAGRKNLKAKLEHELEPTELERHIIGESRDALTRLVERLALPGISLPDDMIHIVTEDEFRRLVSEKAESKVIFGHVYLQRSESPVEFCTYSTHELCHAASRSQVSIAQHADEKRIKVWERQMGFYFQPKPTTESGSSGYFNGLNEGATELCAIGLRRDIAEHSKTFSDEEKQKLKAMIEYRPWVVVVDYLIRLVAEQEHSTRTHVRDELFRDYFSGRFDFVKKVDQYKKGASRLLRTANSSKGDAVEIAKGLGLTEALRVIG